MTPGTGKKGDDDPDSRVSVSEPLTRIFVKGKQGKEEKKSERGREDWR